MSGGDRRASPEEGTCRAEPVSSWSLEMAAAGSSESGVASTDMQLESSQEEMVLEDTAWEQYPLKK